MSREEAIEILIQHRATVCFGCMHPQEMGWCEEHCGIKEALNMAVEALEQEDEE